MNNKNLIPNSPNNFMVGMHEGNFAYISLHKNDHIKIECHFEKNKNSKMAIVPAKLADPKSILKSFGFNFECATWVSNSFTGRSNDKN